MIIANGYVGKWNNTYSKSDTKAQYQSEQEIADAATKKINDKASANAKLKALGLTDDEIEAIK